MHSNLFSCSVLFCCLIGLTNTATAQSVTFCTLFEEQDGLLVMETESVLTTDSWSQRNDLNDALGSGYIEWKPGDNNQGIDPAGSGIMTYGFTVSQAGSYRFLLRSSSPDFTEHNDVWVRFPDNPATGIREGGPGMIDINPNSWFKVYQNTDSENWKWDARTVDHDPHEIYLTIDTPGTYSVQLSGRSTLFKIDRLVLFNEQVSYSDATSLSNSESVCAETETFIFRAPDQPAQTLAGLYYRYYEGNWSLLPDFTTLVPITRGITQEFDITLSRSEDYFGFLFEGYVQAPSDGLYSFFTVSNSGSQLYIGEELVVDNDGAHAARERSGVIALQAGLHRISVLFFEDFFAQSLSVSWIAPGMGRETLGEGDLFYNPADVPPSGVSIESDESILPNAVALHPNYPNPFNLATTFAFDLPREGPVHLSLYNASGQLIEVLLDGVKPAGRTETPFQAPSNLPNGLYFYRLKASGQTQMGTMMVIR